MRVLVCGGRTYTDAETAYRTLDRVHEDIGIDLVIHGAAAGADTLARTWAHSRGIKTAAYVADWSKHGKSAGPIRNQLMIDDGNPDLVVAFPGGIGTQDMVTRAARARLRVINA